MEKRAEALERLNQQTCLMLGKLAHVEDLLEISIPRAEELLIDVNNFIDDFSAC
jgi:hypothetical protein